MMIVRGEVSWDCQPSWMQLVRLLLEVEQVAYQLNLALFLIITASNWQVTFIS